MWGVSRGELLWCSSQVPHQVHSQHQPHPPPNLSISLPGRRGGSQRTERGKGGWSSRPPGLCLFTPSPGGSGGRRVGVEAGGGVWDQGFKDQGPCSGVRNLLGEKWMSSARGEDGDLEAGGRGRRKMGPALGRPGSEGWRAGSHHCSTEAARTCRRGRRRPGRAPPSPRHSHRRHPRPQPGSGPHPRPCLPLP